MFRADEDKTRGDTRRSFHRNDIEKLYSINYNLVAVIQHMIYGHMYVVRLVIFLEPSCIMNTSFYTHGGVEIVMRHVHMVNRGEREIDELVGGV